MTDNEKLIAIREKVGDVELLAQLAEECTEMAQAALKLRRTIIKINPTIKTFGECTEALIEEHADVCVCLRALCWDDKASRTEIESEKITRWYNRLRGGGV